MAAMNGCTHRRSAVSMHAASHMPRCTSQRLSCCYKVCTSIRALSTLSATVTSWWFHNHIVERTSLLILLPQPCLSFTSPSQVWGEPKRFLCHHVIPAMCWRQLTMCTLKSPFWWVRHSLPLAGLTVHTVHKLTLPAVTKAELLVLYH
jgi:hypothetical protein